MESFLYNWLPFILLIVFFVYAMKSMGKVHKAQIKEYGKPDRSEYIEFGIAFLFIIVSSWINNRGYFIWPLTDYSFSFEKKFLDEMSANDVQDLGIQWINIQRNTFLLTILSFIIMAMRLPKVLNKNKQKLASLHPRRLATVIPLLLIAMLCSTCVWIYFSFGMTEYVIERQEISLVAIVFSVFFINSVFLSFYFSIIYSVMFYNFGIKK